MEKRFKHRLGIGLKYKAGIVLWLGDQTGPEGPWLKICLSEDSGGLRQVLLSEPYQLISAVREGGVG